MNLRHSLSLTFTAVFSLTAISFFPSPASADDTTKVTKPNVTFYFIPG